MYTSCRARTSVGPASEKSIRMRRERRDRRRELYQRESIVPPKLPQLSQVLPEMTDKSATVPVPSPISSSLPEYRYRTMIQRFQMGFSQWMDFGFEFDYLPFLTYDEMDHFARCLNMVDGQLETNAHHFLLELVRFMVSWDVIGHCQKRLVCGLFRQKYYNDFLRTHRATPNNKMRAQGLAALDINVLVKMLEACVHARREYLFYLEREAELVKEWAERFPEAALADRLKGLGLDDEPATHETPSEKGPCEKVYGAFCSPKLMELQLEVDRWIREIDEDLTEEQLEELEEKEARNRDADAMEE